MLLILSEYNDTSALKVSKWLDYLKYEYLMITEKSKISDINITLSNNESTVSFKINERKVTLDQFSHYWYRRGEVIFDMQKLKLNHLNEDILSYLSFEVRSLIEFVLIEMENKRKSVGSYFKSNSNTLIDLKLAIKAGFTIPQTYVIDSQSSLYNIDSKTKKTVTKVLARPVDFRM